MHDTGDSGAPGTLDMEISDGYLSPLFATETSDDGDKMALLDKAIVVIHEDPLSRTTEFEALMEYAIASGSALLLIGGGVQGTALEGLVLNVVRGGRPFAAVQVSGSGAFRRMILEEIATLTGGEVIDRNLGCDLSDFGSNNNRRIRETVLGTARRVLIRKNTTKIIGGGGRPHRAGKATASAMGSNMPADVSSGPARTPTKRRHNGLDHRLSDAPLVADMRNLIATKKAQSAEDAARAVVSRAAGSGQPASKVKRLALHYREKHPVE